MENKLSGVAALPDLEAAQASKLALQARDAPPAREPSSAEQGDLRLVIEESGQAGLFIYKTIDRRTGEVILQLPREDILRLADGEAYKAGALIATKA
jgi:flagellar protein FlaG